MTGRGIDQVLPHPVDPRIYESWVKDARDYVRLAERENGPIPAPVDFRYIWGDALQELERVGPDARIINLETAVTTSDDALPKGINYRMHPKNIGCITVAGIDCCVLANNHLLDWGRSGLVQTLKTLHGAGLHTAGAGADAAQARAPAILSTSGPGRVLVFSYGAASAGVPDAWAATADRPGVAALHDLSSVTVAQIAKQIDDTARPADIVVVSIHWGSNWGYDVPAVQRRFAHALIDSARVDVVHGHSSHHAKGIEIHAGKPILYGCGDFINDYEGISGHEEYRDDLVLMYFPSFDRQRRTLARLTMTPMQLHRFSLRRPSRRDIRWLRDTLDRESRKLGAGVELDGDTLVLRWS